MSEKEKRIRAITKIYYSNQKVQEAILSFAQNREVVPRYLEGFGKRPDTIQYKSEIMNLVNKGATSFHCSEEIWRDPLNINSEMGQEELESLRTGWDLLIDIDSPFLDYSKIAAILIIEELEKHGIENYGIKFSGSKGFHIIIPFKSFPEIFEGIETKKMFPEWPRAISEYLMFKIRRKYNSVVGAQEINFVALKERTNLSKEDLVKTLCPDCGAESKKGKRVYFECAICKTKMERENPKITKRKLKCTNERCPGFFDILKEEEFFFCEKCGQKSLNSEHKSDLKVTYSPASKKTLFTNEFEEEISAEKMASLDLVLVASRHLFRMPYSLHEKTALSSIVIKKEQIENFSPKDANPLGVNVVEYYPNVSAGEAKNLLSSALSWKKTDSADKEFEIKKKYSTMERINASNVSEDLFPKPIKKLLNGLKDGKKRGLFILITFLKCLNFSPEYINNKVREWNKKNDPPLKEGYIKSQIDWHIRQKKQILPPNYSNQSFYKDLNILEKLPDAKNPVSEVLRKISSNN